jgi:hypothetical protein
VFGFLAFTISATPLTFSLRTRPAYSFILPLFAFDFCFAAARLSDSSICFSISFNRRFSPSSIFSFTLPIRTMFLLVWQWVLSLSSVHILTVSVASAAGTGESNNMEKVQVGAIPNQ